MDIQKDAERMITWLGKNWERDDLPYLRQYSILGFILAVRAGILPCDELQVYTKRRTKKRDEASMVIKYLEQQRLIEQIIDPYPNSPAWNFYQDELLAEWGGFGRREIAEFISRTDRQADEFWYKITPAGLIFFKAQEERPPETPRRRIGLI